MSKTLSESAAEILQASMTNAGKEAAQTLSTDMEDLSGEHDNGTVDAIAMASRPGIEDDEDFEEEDENEDEDENMKEEVEQIDELDAATYRSAGAKRDQQAQKAFELDTPETDKAGRQLRDKSNKLIRAAKKKEQGDFANSLSPATRRKLAMGEEVEQMDEARYQVVGKTKENETFKSKIYPTKEKALGTHYKMSKSGRFKNINTVKVAEEVEQIEQIEQDTEIDYKEQTKKDLLEKYRGSMREDVDALFNGESLSEDFRVKATLIFETAVQSRVENIVEEVLSENEEVLDSAIEEIKSELTEQVDEYLNYVVEQWMEENSVAIETGLRAELSEDFIFGLKNLFNEHYIEIPEEKVDLAEELAMRLVQLEEASAIREEEFAALEEQVNAVKKEKAIRLACEGLTEVQAGKMKSLAESVEFTAEGDFDNKLAIIRENYFPSKIKVNSEIKAIQQRMINEEPEVEQVNGIMAHYVKALSKTAPKA